MCDLVDNADQIQFFKALLDFLRFYGIKPLEEHKSKASKISVPLGPFIKGQVELLEIDGFIYQHGSIQGCIPLSSIDLACIIIELIKRFLIDESETAATKLIQVSKELDCIIAARPTPFSFKHEEAINAYKKAMNKIELFQEDQVAAIIFAKKTIDEFKLYCQSYHTMSPTDCLADEIIIKETTLILSEFKLKK